MAVRYYDDAIIEKILRWIPENSDLRVLNPSESKRLFELTADDKNDANIKLPLVALSRNPDITLISNIKQPKSYDGLSISADEAKTAKLNIIPIKVEYKLDIYTKTAYDCEEYMRNFLFKLINNPTIMIEIPYNNLHIKHIANIRVSDSVSDTSDIPERLFSGQFTRWTISFEIQDAFLFSIPYRQNWKFVSKELEVSDSIDSKGDIEVICVRNQEENI